MIKIDMEMPERCSKCPFVNVIICACKLDMCCTLTKEHFDLDFMEEHKRHTNCPLKEAE